MGRRQIRVALVSIIGAVVLFHYQNCAQPLHSKGVILRNESGTVRIVEDWNSSKLSFVENAVAFHSGTKEISLEGMCDSKISRELNWVLESSEENNERENDQGREVQLSFVQQGLAQCQFGGFSLKLESLEKLKCGVEYQLSLQDVDGETAVLQLERQCSSFTTETESVARLENR